MAIRLEIRNTEVRLNPLQVEVKKIITNGLLKMSSLIRFKKETKETKVTPPVNNPGIKLPVGY